MIKNPHQHTILVTGATGQQGGAVARHLLAKDFRVRALTRNPGSSTARKLSEKGAEIVEGDFEDRSSLNHALDGVYGTFSVQNTFTAGVEGEIRQGKAFAEAALQAGVEHFVYSSVGGAERETGIPHFDSKWEIEQHVRSLELPATILRPVYFMDNWSSMEDTIHNGQLPQPLSPDTSLQQIAVEDIGGFAALSFANPDKWIGQSAEIAGDELTMTETADVMSEALDREVQYIQVPWDDFEEQMGEEFAVMHRWFEENGYEADIPALRDIYPDLKRLKTFLNDVYIG